MPQLTGRDACYASWSPAHRPRSRAASSAATAPQQALNSPPLFEVLKWIGALYLVGLGLAVLWTNRHRDPAAVSLTVDPTPRLTRSEQGRVGLQLAILGCIHHVVEAVAAMGWAGAGRLLGKREISARVVQNTGRASGVVFVGLGVGLAVSSPTSGNSAERPDQQSTLPYAGSVRMRKPTSP